MTKRDLLSALLLPIQQSWLKIAAGLALGEALELELSSFRMKLTAAGRTPTTFSREGESGHSDLVIALALATRRPNLTVTLELVEAIEGV